MPRHIHKIAINIRQRVETLVPIMTWQITDADAYSYQVELEGRFTLNGLRQSVRVNISGEMFRHGLMSDDEIKHHISHGVADLIVNLK